MDSDPTTASELEAPDGAPAVREDGNGVDLTPIDMMLSLSPAERLDVLFETASSLARLMPDAYSDQVL